MGLATIPLVFSFSFFMIQLLHNPKLVLKIKKNSLGECFSLDCVEICAKIFIKCVASDTASPGVQVRAYMWSRMIGILYHSVVAILLARPKDRHKYILKQTNFAFLLSPPFEKVSE